MKKPRKDLQRSNSYLNKPFHHRQHNQGPAQRGQDGRGPSCTTSAASAPPQRGFDYFDNHGFQDYREYGDGYNNEVESRSCESGHCPTSWTHYRSAHGNLNEDYRRDQHHNDFPESFDDSYVDEDDGNPIEKRRKCRDMICLGIFMLSIIVMVLAIGYSYLNGDLQRITHFYTTNGCDTCGKLNRPLHGINVSGKDLRDFPYGLVTYAKRKNLIDLTSVTNVIFTTSSKQFTTSECVKECPVATKTVLHRCIPDNSTTNVFSSLQIVPESSTTSNDIFDKARAFFNELAMDVENSWKDIIFISLIGLAISITMTIFLRLFAGLIIWVVIFCISAISIAGTIALWIIWSGIKVNKAKADDDGGGGDENEWTPGEKIWILAGAITVSVVTVLLLLVFLVMRKRISLVIRLFNEAGKAVHSMPILLLQPIFTFIAIASAISGWLILALLIESSGIPEVKSVEIDNIKKEFCYLEKNWVILFGRYWNLFMMFWITQFIIGSQHLIIAGAISSWFFTRKKSRLHFPILTALQRLICYHLGSVAFGSLIIAIVKIIRYILTVVQKRVEGSKMAICQGILCCCKCCLLCLEKFLIFLNRNAYIEIAIHGYGFCKSARRAFKIIVNNALRVAAINSIGDFILFLSKLAIVGVTLVIGYYFLKGREDIHHVWIPLTLAGICCYFIAHCFISVYEMAIDTIFICFCEDVAMNDGVHKPYFMSKGLMEFVKFGAKE